MIYVTSLETVDGEAKRVYFHLDRPYRVGDLVSFTCNGRGRGGHFRVDATVTKVNRKTLAATEVEGSYRPGTRWSLDKDSSITVIL